MEAALQRINGQLPVLQTRGMYPENAPSYRVVAMVRWRNASLSDLRQAAEIIDGAFRSAPEDKLAAALYRLRMVTRGRAERSESDQEAEAIIWIEQLRCWPGDIVLDVLKTWPSQPNGQWWPTWSEVGAELKKRTDRRMALANFVRDAIRAESVVSIAKPEDASVESVEDARRRVEEHWQTFRPLIEGSEQVAGVKKHLSAQQIKEAAEERLKALHARKGEPVSVSEALAANIGRR